MSFIDKSGISSRDNTVMFGHLLNDSNSLMFSDAPNKSTSDTLDMLRENEGVEDILGGKNITEVI
jgi:hypothetical protein